MDTLDGLTPHLSSPALVSVSQTLSPPSTCLLSLFLLLRLLAQLAQSAIILPLLQGHSWLFASYHNQMLPDMS